MIEKIKYLHGTGLQKGTAMPRDLMAAVSIGRKEMTAGIANSFAREEIENLSGTYGDPSMGEPVEIDFLEISVSNREAISVQAFNRGITLLVGDSDEMRRLHRFICVLEDELGHAD